MKSRTEIRDGILENCVDEFGDIILSSLDFSEFDGDVDISFMKVKHSLTQNYQKVGGNLYLQKTDHLTLLDEELNEYKEIKK